MKVFYLIINHLAKVEKYGTLRWLPYQDILGHLVTILILRPLSLNCNKIDIEGRTADLLRKKEITKGKYIVNLTKSEIKITKLV